MNNLQSVALLAVAGVVGYALFKAGKVGSVVADAAGDVADFVSNPNPISETAENAVRTVTGNDTFYLSDVFAWMTGLDKREQEYLAPTPNKAAPLEVTSTM